MKRKGGSMMNGDSKGGQREGKKKATGQYGK